MSADRAQDDPASELALLRLLVESNRDEYKELSELWRHLDTKAQGVIAIAGILLAAFVAFLTKNQTALPCGQRMLFITAVVLFTVSIALSVFSLKLRESVGPPHFGGLQTIVTDLLKLPEKRSS